MENKSECLQHELFNQKTDSYKINNQLLRACIGGETRVEGLLGKSFFKGFQAGKCSEGYVILCTLVSNVLQIKRCLYTPDRIISSLSGNLLQRMVDIHLKLSPQQWESSEAELIHLYDHVQAKLSIYFSNEKPLKLKRCINGQYAAHIKKLCHAAKYIGQTDIPVEMDMLNSYMSINDVGYSNEKTISLLHEVPINDVLYCHSLIQPYERDFPYGLEDTEEGEWVVINRSRDGIIRFPIDAFIFPKDEISSRYFINSEEEAYKILEQPHLYIRSSSNILSTIRLQQEHLPKLSVLSRFLQAVKRKIPF